MGMNKLTTVVVLGGIVGLGRAGTTATLEAMLLQEDPAALAREARLRGDAARGAVLFFQPALTCARCHEADAKGGRIGPDLSRPPEGVHDADLVDAVLRPSKQITKGFETVLVTTTKGSTVSGLVAEDRPDRLVLRDPAREFQAVTIAKADIDERSLSAVSLMPAGLVNQLATRQQFLDLIRYLLEVTGKGPARARELRPDPALLSPPPLPDYERHLDHAGLIRGLDGNAFERGEAIYHRVCVNCHGTKDRAGSLPTSLRFATGRFKNGSDPFGMYQTLTRGFGLMTPQVWMVPRQKYDVIHYVREAFLKEANPSQYVRVDAAYLAGLPRGDTSGPEPSDVEPCVAMDYGPTLMATYEVGNDGSNFAHKGIAVRLDPGPGGISHGRAWALYDHDTMRLAAAWEGEGFIDWDCIHFNGRHQVHPHVVGRVAVANPSGPGWADPATGRFDDVRLRGRDGRAYGPLPRQWLRYRGLYHHGQSAVLSYTVGGTEVLETPGLAGAARAPLFTRTFNVGPRRSELTLQVARSSAGNPALDTGDGNAVFGAPDGDTIRAGLVGTSGGARWISEGRDLRLRVPAGNESLRFTLWLLRAESPPVRGQRAVRFVPALRDSDRDLTAFTHGGPARWPARLSTQPGIGGDEGPFAVDTLTHPAENPWCCQTRFTGLDFLPGGGAVVCSWDGDVWLVEGVTQPARGLRWQRIASGLFQPLGIKVVDGRIYVGCRDQIVILHDLNGDGETDFYESFNSDHQVTDHFHEFAMGLQTDAAGNFYYCKGGRHALKAVVPQHGTLLRVSKDGTRTDILATGFRAANGVCVNPDGSFFLTDQEGHWTPKNRVNLVTQGGFYGYMWGYHGVTDTSDSAMRQPVCWITNDFDRSPAEMLWVEGKAWGPLGGSLLNLSYGTGKIFVVPFEKVDGEAQGGMSRLPIPLFPTGVMRGRFHPADGQLYCCGMYAWAGNQQQPGGLFRVRYTGKPVWLPVGLRARRAGLEVTFSASVDGAVAADAQNYAVKTWSLKRTANYGSDHYNERPARVTAVDVSADSRTVLLRIEGFGPTQSMEVKYFLKGPRGETVDGVIHNTVHRLGN